MSNNHLAYWYHTSLNQNVIEAIIEDLQPVEDHFFKQGEVNSQNEGENLVDLSIRDSKVCFLPTSHWMAGFVWHYIIRSNQENFGYDIEHFDDALIQYTSYGPGQFYNWHTDCGQPGINVEKCRKLSFSLQLSNEEDYTGGELQFLSPDTFKTFFAPKERGTLIIFDSRVPHRVKKVKSGRRRSLVGWVRGPRWR